MKHLNEFLNENKDTFVSTYEKDYNNIEKNLENELNKKSKSFVVEAGKYRLDIKYLQKGRKSTLSILFYDDVEIYHDGRLKDEIKEKMFTTDIFNKYLNDWLKIVNRSYANYINSTIDWFSTKKNLNN